MGKRRNKTTDFSVESTMNSTEFSETDGIEGVGFFSVPETDLSKLIELYHFGEILPGRSNVSRSAFTVSLPDPSDPEAQFFYNYFLPDERKQIVNDNMDGYLFDPLSFSTSDIEYLARQEQLPRYVKLKFKQPKYSDTLPTSLLSGKSMPASLDALMSPEDLSDLSSGETFSVDMSRHLMGNLSDVFPSGLTSKELVDQVVSTLIVEGAASNPNFSGVEIIDTLADSKVYTMLSSSMTFQDIGISANSPRERAELFYEKILDNQFVPLAERDEYSLPNPLGMEKRVLVSILSEMQPAGIALAPNDVTDEQAALATDPITKQSFSTKFNNLFIGDIVKNAARNANTVFEDEIRGLEPVAHKIQKDIIASIDPTLFYEHDFNLQVTPLSIRKISYSQSDMTSIIDRSKAQLQAYINFAAAQGLTLPNLLVGGTENNMLTMLVNAALMGLIDPMDLFLQQHNVPNAKIVGYLVQKTEVRNDGTTQEFPNIFIDNPSGFSELIDHRVRYGAVYNYKLRTIAKVSAIIKTIDTFKAGEGSFVVGDFLVASDGEVVSVKCDEHIPPPPPTRVRARVDHTYRKPVITWEFPFVTQRDVKRFQIFKRSTLNEPFVLLAEYDFDDSFDRVIPLETAQEESLISLNYPKRSFRDDDFNLGYDEAIYAISCVDAHGLSSNYSAQILVKYDKYTNRLSSTVICAEGSPKPYPNLNLQQDFFEDIIRSSSKLRCTLFFDPEYSDVYKYEVDHLGNFTKTYQELFKTSDVNFNYTLQLINLDMQQDRLIKIKIVDRADENISIPAATISKSNLSFEFGV